jgi:hypothetical protein
VAATVADVTATVAEAAVQRRLIAYVVYCVYVMMLLCVHWQEADSIAKVVEDMLARTQKGLKGKREVRHIKTLSTTTLLECCMAVMRSCVKCEACSLLTPLARQCLHTIFIQVCKTEHLLHLHATLRCELLAGHCTFALLLHEILWHSLRCQSMLHGNTH